MDTLRHPPKFWSIPSDTANKLETAAISAYKDWDSGWPEIKKVITFEGQSIRCKEKCTSCCFTRRFASLSEGIAILRFMRKELSAEQNESIRFRVESTASSIKKLREDGYCDTEAHFQSVGGIECPFLLDEQCSVYPVRPLDCRTLQVSTKTNVEECRKCPSAAGCNETKEKKAEIQTTLLQTEVALLGATVPKQEREGKLLPEVLSLLWQTGTEPAPEWYLTEKSWENRLKTKMSVRDDTWQDDGLDFSVMKHPLSLPEEGNYPSDLTLLKARSKVHDVYDKQISDDTLPDFLTLYKRHEDGFFDWKSRAFYWGDKNQGNKELPYTCWMSDGPQERLMMWEAAKRSRGHVLCGGLGLGVYPQLALSLPRVDSVHIVEMDNDVIQMIKQAWKKKNWPRMNQCKISRSKIEEFLSTTNETFDVVYIDTWDAIYHEYLPHLNELTKLARRVLRPGGEILLWAFDLKVRSFLETAKALAPRRENYLRATPEQLQTIKHKFPLLFKLVAWLKNNPTSSDNDLQDEAYRLATEETENLGILKLANQSAGGQELVNEKYFPEKPSK